LVRANSEVLQYKQSQAKYNKKQTTISNGEIKQKLEEKKNKRKEKRHFQHNDDLIIQKTHGLIL